MLLLISKAPPGSSNVTQWCSSLRATPHPRRRDFSAQARRHGGSRRPRHHFRIRLVRRRQWRLWWTTGKIITSPQKKKGRINHRRTMHTTFHTFLQSTTTLQLLHEQVGPSESHGLWWTSYLRSARRRLMALMEHGAIRLLRIPQTQIRPPEAPVPR